MYVSYVLHSTKLITTGVRKSRDPFLKVIRRVFESTRELVIVNSKHQDSITA
jgi:nucleoside-triphosphatase THEP1